MECKMASRRAVTADHGQPVADAKVSIGLLDGSGKQILAKEQQARVSALRKAFDLNLYQESISVIAEHEKSQVCPCAYTGMSGNSFPKGWKKRAAGDRAAQRKFRSGAAGAAAPKQATLEAAPKQATLDAAQKQATLAPSPSRNSLAQGSSEQS